MSDEGDNVVTHAKFTGSGDRGAVDKIIGDIPITPHTLDDLNKRPEVKPVASTDYRVGALTDYEVNIYVEVSLALEATLNHSRMVSGEALKKLGESIVNGTVKDPTSPVHSDVDEDKIEKLFALNRKEEFLKSLLYHKVCTRIGYSDHLLTIRQDGEVVSLGRKW